MATFFFRAVASDGKMRTGSLAGGDEKTIARELRKQGLTPVYVGVAPKGTSVEIKLPVFGGRKKKDVLFFTQELSTLLNSSVPLDRALSITAELTERPSFRFVVLDVLRVLKGGRSLADSLGTHPDYFSDLYLNMVRAGEASGSLAIIFERLADFERSRDDLRNYIITSMVYPALLALVGVASVLILLEFVVPRFATIFSGNMKIPTPTMIMLEASRLVNTYGWMAAAALVTAIVVFRVYIGTGTGRLWWDRARLKLPLLGDALLKAETSRFARAMATLIGNSVPLVQSIGIASATLNNRSLSTALVGVSQGVKRGEGIAGPLRKAAVFPPLAAHLLTVGEETGRLDAMFTRMADIYETDTRAAIKRFTAIFEPAVILVMGIIVGALILSMLLAITSINDVAM
jgi:general secretion pathway protein F